jgi:enoyl-CoA hydratase
MSKSKNYDVPPELSVTVAGAIRIIALERPDDLNAANSSLHGALGAVWEQIAADEDARAVVLIGRGRAFSAGGDFQYMQDCIDNPDVRERTIDEARRIVEGMVRCELPVVAAVNGPAVGLGCSLAMLSDIVLMSERSFFADPHLSMGLVPGDGGMAWPLLAGLSRAKYYLMLGERILPEDAVRFGLAHRVVAPENLETEALALAERLAAVPRKAMRDTKKALNAYLEVQLGGSFDLALRGELASMSSAEHAEAVARVSRAKS